MTPDVVELLRSGRYTEINELFAPQLRALVPPDAVESAWTAAVAEHGPLVGTGPAVTSEGVTRIPLEFEHGRLTLVVSAGSQGLGGLQLAPASAAEPIEPWAAPSYVDPDSFTEQEVSLGSVNGTLSLPRGDGPWPAVVMLTGSGAHDRDETIGRNKPFKDIAWGLASRGVAALRFDKITHTDPASVLANPSFTVMDEYAPAALSAVSSLRQRDDIASVHLLGHSLGGTIAPRVAAAGSGVSGLILLAGGTQPMHWSAVRQLRYIGSTEGTVAAITRQAELVDSPALSADTPATELPFGVAAPYWLDLRGYDAPATAASLGVPVFIAQGARDYQVTVADDLPLWQAALAGRPDVTVRIYDADNHMFFRGSGPSKPAEYEPAQHVDPELVTDLAAWLTA